MNNAVAMKKNWSPLWKTLKFTEAGYEASKHAREQVAKILKRAEDMRIAATRLRSEQNVRAARILEKDSFALVDQGLYLQNRVLTPFTYDVGETEDNLLLNEGITRLLNLLIGGGGVTFANANAYLGVGDSSTAASATQTGLQAATNKLYKVMDATYPSISNQTVTWQSTFQSTDANFAWNEFTVANGSSDASENLNRKVSAQGTKASGQVWTLQLAVTMG